MPSLGVDATATGPYMARSRVPRADLIPAANLLGSMPSDKIDVRYVAKLARLALSPDEIESYSAQLGDFLTHVDALKELDTQDVPATAQVIHARNVGREDVIAQCLPRDEVLAAAPQAYGAYFRVPRIIGET